jgi:ankyrin repeat protein
MEKMFALLSVCFLFAGRAFAQDQADFLQLVRTATPEQISAAIAQGADVNQYDRDGATPLMFAAACNPNPEAIGTLLQAGAKLDARNKDGVTALMYAAD